MGYRASNIRPNEGFCNIGATSRLTMTFAFKMCSASRMEKNYVIGWLIFSLRACVPSSHDLCRGNFSEPAVHSPLGSHTHAVQYELRRSAVSKVIVFPTGFGERLASSVRGGDEDRGDSFVEALERRVAMYTLEEIWKASLLLVPIPIERHWILMAVTNPYKAVPRGTSRPEDHTVSPGELKPDREPFAILVLNSAPLYKAKAISKLPTQLRKFLEVGWCKLKGTSLEYTNWSSVRVSLSRCVPTWRL